MSVCQTFIIYMLYVPRWKETRYICVVVVGLLSATVSTATLFFSVLAISSLSSFTYSLVLVTSSRLHSLLPHLEVALVRFLLLFYYIVNNNFFLRASTTVISFVGRVCVVCAYFAKVYSNVFELTNRTNLTMFIIRSISCTLVHFIRSTIHAC